MHSSFGVLCVILIPMAFPRSGTLLCLQTGLYIVPAYISTCFLLVCLSLWVCLGTPPPNPVFTRGPICASLICPSSQPRVWYDLVFEEFGLWGLTNWVQISVSPSNNYKLLGGSLNHGPQFLSAVKQGENTLIQSWWGLNEMVHVQHLSCTTWCRVRDQ